MKRIISNTREDFKEKLSEVGVVCDESSCRWDESAHWEFTAGEIDLVEEATNELHEMSMAAMDVIFKKERHGELGIPDALVDELYASWRRKDLHLLGRMDFALNEAFDLKLLEYNADSPKGIISSSVAQWQWLQDMRKDADQFNSIHESLVERWKKIGNKMPMGATMHFTSGEDEAGSYENMAYLMETAIESGMESRYIPIGNIGWKGTFVDENEERIKALYKFYPWDLIAEEEYAEAIYGSGTTFIEPVWKMALSSKGLLAILWEMFPNHNFLLPTYFSREPLGGKPIVSKTMFSTNGEGVAIHSQSGKVIAGKVTSENQRIFQEYRPLLRCGEDEARSMTLGAWVVGDKCRGMEVIENEGLITDANSLFVPHYFI